MAAPASRYQRSVETELGALAQIRRAPARHPRGSIGLLRSDDVADRAVLIPPASVPLSFGNRIRVRSSP